MLPFLGERRPNRRLANTPVPFLSSGGLSSSSFVFFGFPLGDLTTSCSVAPLSVSGSVTSLSFFLPFLAFEFLRGEVRRSGDAEDFSAFSTTGSGEGGVTRSSFASAVFPRRFGDFLSRGLPERTSEMGVAEERTTMVAKYLPRFLMPLASPSAPGFCMTASTVTRERSSLPIQYTSCLANGVIVSLQRNSFC